MNAQFTDRLLRCSDCQGEFIFTAGEQLFFQDKQFKNDPKRCKPCKSRRSGLAAAANGTGPAAAGLSRTETRTTCSECSVETTVPFKPTQGRPVLCRMCFQARNRAAQPLAAAAVQAPAALEMGLPALVATTAATTAATISALTQVSATANGPTMSVAEALVAAASMASASPESSVASAADLASISFQREPVDTHGTELIGTEVLAAANAPTELAAAWVETAEA